MFHGPNFRGVASVDRWGTDGAEATLRVLPADGLLRSDPDPPFITDPVLLDQPGQVVGFWTSDHLKTGYVVFPFRLEALHLYGPNLGLHERSVCRARINLMGEGQVRSDLDIVGPDGHVRIRFEGWWDLRFDLPDLVFRTLLSPQDAVLSAPWLAPRASLPDTLELQIFQLSVDAFPEAFFTAHGGIWRRMLAQVVLSRRERALWEELRTPEPRRLEWLLGRIVAKDAVRQHLKQRYDLALCPADIEILPDGDGRPLAQGVWIEQVPVAPMLSLSHASGVAVAAVGDAGVGSGMGVDIERLGRMNEDIKKFAFTSQEQDLLSALPDMENDGWPLRFWCAKEAVAKALGQGMILGPQALFVKDLDVTSGMVRIGVTGDLASRVRTADGSTFTAFTLREGDLMLAISLYNGEARAKTHEKKSQ
jgi:phosphopantetheinyl transferase